MSIYAVYMPHWFPKKDKLHETAKAIIDISTCYQCGRKIQWKKAWGMHSLPYGGPHDTWCSKACYYRWRNDK